VVVEMVDSDAGSLSEAFSDDDCVPPPVNFNDNLPTVAPPGGEVSSEHNNSAYRSDAKEKSKNFITTSIRFISLLYASIILGYMVLLGPKVSWFDHGNDVIVELFPP